MPRSKRERNVSLTKTGKKATRETKGALMEEIRSHCDKWKYVWLFSVGNMRNSALKDVRQQWKGTGRIFLGRCKVMAKALGTTPESEYKPGLSKLAQKLQGPLGLFFTSSTPDETISWFQSFQKPDFARAGNKATREVILHEGPLLMYNDPSSPFPASMDPQLRKLGLTTKLVKGIPSLDVSHVVCRKGDKLTAEQAQLLKLVGERMAEFKVRLVGHWSEDDGWVEDEGIPSDDENDVNEGDLSENDDVSIDD